MASQTGQRLDSNQEFVGQGCQHRMRVLRLPGYRFLWSAQSQLAGRVKVADGQCLHGLMVLHCIALRGRFGLLIPGGAGRVILVTAYFLIDRKEISRIHGGGRRPLTLVIMLVSTLLLPLQFAIMAGILMSLAGYFLQTSTPRAHCAADKGFSPLRAPA
jgi:SulP family sulfate permease